MFPFAFDLRVEFLVLEEFALEVLVGREGLMQEGLGVLVLTLDLRPSIHARTVLRKELLVQLSAFILTLLKKVFSISVPLMFRIEFLAGQVDFTSGHSNLSLGVFQALQEV
jgi:hypothetical protein